MERIVGAYRAFGDKEGFARVATLDEIRVQEANLSIPLYVRPATAVREQSGAYGERSLAGAIADWQASSDELRRTMDDLFATLAEAGFTPSSGGSHE